MTGLSIIGSICFISIVFTLIVGFTGGGFFSKLISFILSVCFIYVNVLFAQDEIVIGKIILNVIPIVSGIIFLIIFISSSGSPSSSSSSSSYSSGSSITTHMDNRNKHPNKCISCTNYRSRGECRLTGNRISEMDSCSSWC